MSTKLLVGLLITMGLAAAASSALAQSLREKREQSAKLGSCTSAPPICMFMGRDTVPVLKANCQLATWPNGTPKCQTPVSLFCGVGYQPLYRTPNGSLYFSETDDAAYLERMKRWKQSTGLPGAVSKGGVFDLDKMQPWDGDDGGRPDLDPRTRWANAWYCTQVRMLLTFAESDESLIQKLRDNAGLIARFNSVFGGAPDLKTLHKKFAQHRVKLQAEFDDYLQDEHARRKVAWGYYANRMTELNAIRKVMQSLTEDTYRAGDAIVRTAEKGEVLAKKAQKVLIKAAGGVVFVFTGGNRIAQCLTEAGIESAANAVTQKLNGNELTLAGFGKDSLRTLIFRCAEALLEGPGAEILSVITGRLRDVLERIGEIAKEKVRDKIRAAWASISDKVKSVVDKLRFLMNEDLAKVLTDSAEEVVVEFGASLPACIAPLVQKDFQEVFRCLGRSAQRALEVGLPRGLFDAAMDLLERDVPKAKAKLEELAKALKLGNDATVRAFLGALANVAKKSIHEARGCRAQVNGFSSAGAAFRCLAEKLAANLKAAVPGAIQSLLEQVLGSGEDKVVGELRRQRAPISKALAAIGLELPRELVSLLDGAAAEASRAFGKEARKCVAALSGAGALGDRARAALRCVADAARAAVSTGGHALVKGALELLAEEAEKGIAALAAAVKEVTKRLAVIAGEVRLVPAAVVEAIRRAQESAVDAGAKAFAKKLRGECLKVPSRGESVGAYLRASARCVGDAASGALQVAGATALNGMLAEVKTWIRGLEKASSDALAGAAEKIVSRIGAIGPMLGVELKLPTVADLRNALGKNLASVASGSAACVDTLHRAALAAARSHERLSSIARELREPLRTLPSCLGRAAGLQ